MTTSVPGPRRLAVLVGVVAAVLVGIPATAWAAVPTDAESTVAIATAMADGDDVGTARLIASSGFATRPDALGHTIYEGGLLAVARGTGDQYREAVAYGFTRGGVSLADATRTFRAAATEVVLSGLTVDQALVGGPTVVQTYEAYVACTLRCPS